MNVPTFDKYGVASMFDGEDSYGDRQTLDLFRQKDGRRFTLHIENGNCEAGYSNLTAKDLISLATNLLRIAEPLVASKPAELIGGGQAVLHADIPIEPAGDDE